MNKLPDFIVKEVKESHEVADNIRTNPRFEVVVKDANKVGSSSEKVISISKSQVKYILDSMEDYN